MRKSILYLLVSLLILVFAHAEAWNMTLQDLPSSDGALVSATFSSDPSIVLKAEMLLRYPNQILRISRFSVRSAKLLETRELAISSPLREMPCGVARRGQLSNTVFLCTSDTALTEFNEVNLATVSTLDAGSYGKINTFEVDERRGLIFLVVVDPAYQFSLLTWSIKEHRIIRQSVLKTAIRPTVALLAMRSSDNTLAVLLTSGGSASKKASELLLCEPLFSTGCKTFGPFGALASLDILENRFTVVDGGRGTKEPSCVQSLAEDIKTVVDVWCVKDAGLHFAYATSGRFMAAISSESHMRILSESIDVSRSRLQIIDLQHRNSPKSAELVENFGAIAKSPTIVSDGAGGFLLFNRGFVRSPLLYVTVE